MSWRPRSAQLVGLAPSSNSLLYQHSQNYLTQAPFTTAPRNPWGALIVPPKLDGPTLDLMCELLVQLNVRYLRENPQTPPLYQSGVRYTEEDGREHWKTIPWILWLWHNYGIGQDCDGLAAWRCAELRVRHGERSAKCIGTPHNLPGVLMYHVRVRRADGSIEDPSALLGMR